MTRHGVKTHRRIDGAQILLCVRSDTAGRLTKLCQEAQAKNTEQNYKDEARLPGHHIFLSQLPSPAVSLQQLQGKQRQTDKATQTAA